MADDDTWKARESLQRDQHQTVEEMVKLYTHNIDYVHKMLALAIGTIAFVPAILAANQARLHVDFIKVEIGVTRLMWCTAIGVVGLVLSRFSIFTFIPILRYGGKAGPWTWATLIVWVLLEVLFFGTFIAGVWWLAGSIHL